jgi:hypothetical protein
MIDETDFIVKNGRRLFKMTCDACGANRGYKRNTKSKIDAWCRSCSQQGVDDEKDFPNVDFKDFVENTRSKAYKTTCISCKKSKGYALKKDTLKPCLSCAAKIRHTSMAKDKKELTKIKISCTQRNISIEDFNDFSTEVKEKERSKFKQSGLRKQCYENANYTCDLYGIKGCELNVHHLDSWDNNEEGRFELDNLVCLSEPAHKVFHKKYGKGSNTRFQYEEFKKEVNSYTVRSKQDLFIIAGCPASGKSWACEQLKDKFNYVPYDGINKDLHIYELLKNNDKPLLFDPTIKVSTFIKRIGHLFNIRLIVIIESEGVINSRMISRGGKITDTIKRRIKRMNNLVKKAEFSGTSDQVLEYLKKI